MVVLLMMLLVISALLLLRETCPAVVFTGIVRVAMGIELRIVTILREAITNLIQLVVCRSKIQRS